MMLKGGDFVSHMGDLESAGRASTSDPWSTTSHTAMRRGRGRQQQQQQQQQQYYHRNDDDDDDDDDDDQQRQQTIPLLSSNHAARIGAGGSGSGRVNYMMMNPSIKASLYRMAAMARPEMYLLVLSAVTLAFTSGVQLLIPFSAGKIVDIALQQQQQQQEHPSMPLHLLAGLFGIMTFAAFLTYQRAVWEATAGHRLVARMRRRLFRSLLSQEAAFFDVTASTGSGDMISRLTADSQLVQEAITSTLLSAMRSILMGLGAASMLLYTSPSLALVSMATLPPIVCMARSVGRRMRDKHKRVSERHGHATSVAEQSLTCLATVQQFVAEEYEAHKYNVAIHAAHAEAVHIAQLQAAFSGIVQIVGNGAMLCVLGFGGTLVARGLLSPGDLTRFAMYSLIMAGNLSGLSNKWLDLLKGVAASNRVFEILDRVPTIPPATSSNNNTDMNNNIWKDNDSDNDNFLTFSSAATTSSLTLSSPKKSFRQIIPFWHQPISTAAAGAGAGAGVASSQVNQSDTTSMAIKTTSSGRSWKTSSHHHHDHHHHRPISVEFRNVSFFYPARPDVQVLGPGFSLSIPPGKVLALVGYSGEGKSTVAALLTRLYDLQLPRHTNDYDGNNNNNNPNHRYRHDKNDDSFLKKKKKEEEDNSSATTPKLEGAIFMDGVNIMDMTPQQVRENVGIVSQEPMLFPCSIADNIRYGKLDATHEEVVEAARLGNVLEFAERFPDGLDTMVGPAARGTQQLSGGQKQRVAVARAILKNPPILILDEATSALDSASEHLVQKAIDAAIMKGGEQHDDNDNNNGRDTGGGGGGRPCCRTVISIAHRLSTIRNAHQIAVLQGGKVAEIGSFEELVANRNGPFRQLMERQIVTEEEDDE